MNFYLWISKARTLISDAFRFISGNGLVRPIGRSTSLGDEKEDVEEMKEVDIHRPVTVE